MTSNSKTERCDHATQIKNNGHRSPVVLCDWGSSNLRLYLVDGNDRVIDTYTSNCGVKKIAGNRSLYAEELQRALDALHVNKGVEVRISGMAGSKLGWHETAYNPTPLDAKQFASSAYELPDFPNVSLLGGVSHAHGKDATDIMRGEEVQIFGLASQFSDARVICLPGTHSKWVTMDQASIDSFKTYMTGDLFASLCKESIFKEQITSKDFHREGFLHGCHLAKEGNDLQELFRLRSEFVFSKISNEAFHSCLSGFLIMNEIMSAKPSGTVYLCGAEPLMELYALTLSQVGIDSVSVDCESATVKGHLTLLYT